MEEVLIPDGFLRLRDAVASLVKGMYASFPQPKPLHKVKLDHQKASVGFAPWKEAAAHAFELQRAMVSCRFLKLIVLIGSLSYFGPILLVD